MDNLNRHEEASNEIEHADAAIASVNLYTKNLEDDELVAFALTLHTHPTGQKTACEEKPWFDKVSGLFEENEDLPDYVQDAVMQLVHIRKQGQ